MITHHPRMGEFFSDISSNKKHTNHRNHPTENKKKIPIYKISTGRPRNKRSVKSYVKNFRTESGALVVYKENKRGSWFSGMNYNGHVTGPLCMKVKKISLIDENWHMYAQKNIDGKEHYFHGSSFGWTAPGTTATNYIEEIDRKDFLRGIASGKTSVSIPKGTRVGPKKLIIKYDLCLQEGYFTVGPLERLGQQYCSINKRENKEPLSRNSLSGHNLGSKVQCSSISEYLIKNMEYTEGYILNVMKQVQTGMALESVTSAPSNHLDKKRLCRTINRLEERIKCLENSVKETKNLKEANGYLEKIKKVKVRLQRFNSELGEKNYACSKGKKKNSMRRRSKRDRQAGYDTKIT